MVKDGVFCPCGFGKTLRIQDICSNKILKFFTQSYHLLPLTMVPQKLLQLPLSQWKTFWWFQENWMSF